MSMEDSHQNVAPLNITKGRSRPPIPQLDFSSINRTPSTNRGKQENMTPPLTPHGSRGTPEGLDNSRSLFHNYLRAFYPFHPSSVVSPSTVTLPLNQGDIILVHSVHVNGWADGTLLETGERGWLPTNYCEAYDHQPMRPLLKALTDFWDIIRGGCGTSLRDFSNQDLMKGLIAGVRYLLERSECLTREAHLVQRYEGLRRNRKALLADLSSLVKSAKRLQELAKGTPHDDEVEHVLDEMLLKSFKIVTRGVKFLDVWNEYVGLTRAILDLEPPSLDDYDTPMLTPPIDTFNIPDRQTEASPERNWSRPTVSRNSTRTEMECSPHPPSVMNGQSKRISVSHRVSYSGGSVNQRNPDLASERLVTSYDAFLGVLGSFIGLHLQSRSSTELILTTQQAVQSCRELLSVVEAIWEHDLRRSSELEYAKDSMYDLISELVQAAREAFRPNSSDDDVVFMPDEGKRIVDAATDCVRGAGSCLARSLGVLEQIGDIEIDPSCFEQAPSSELATPQPTRELMTTVKDSPQPSLRLLPPPISIPNRDLSPATPALTDGTTPSSMISRTGLQSPKLDVDLAFTPLIGSEVSLSDPTYQEHCSLEDTQHLYRYETRGTTSTGSSFTYQSTVRDSEMSGVSQTSTRATSPDINTTALTPSLKESLSRSTLAEESDEAEANVLEKTFAHELMFKDGQVVGGSLRALIEKLTAHQSTPDALFVSTFYLTFRLFASPLEFAEALVERYDYIGETQHAAGPVRLRVYNVFKGWLEAHWRHDCDGVALNFIFDFANNKLIHTLSSAGKRLIELAEKVRATHGPVVPRLLSSIGKTNTSVVQYVPPETPLPAPSISKSQMGLLKQWKYSGTTIGILDFDPLELARQITIKESQIFCSILPEELLATEWMKKSGSLAVNVRAMSTLSTDLANLVADSILQLEEPKKRAAVIKQWVKIANKCLDLNNYDSLMAIICSLNSSTIVRLKRTWELVSQKTKTTLESLKEVVDVSRNYAVLRQRLQNCAPPTLPFVGVYLTDLTFVDHGNPAERNLPTEHGGKAVINYDKHMKTAKIISELQRFQIPYRLTEVPELQTWMQDQFVRVRSSGEKSFQNYYRRSLILEPREMSRGPTADSSASLTPLRETAKDKFDFLSWAYSSKAKSVMTTS
ncbi:putative ras guanine-nucleotide exchange protein [Talaromyces proteolyticus]|uniref:Ras guanine-nucleotide exchange protein n=1 Tax=Talaromyces proteolyticus TaxID=1131652 RepID=A0AAD4PXU9_9EURO|nr:putative ras guanine-nucleotide exchange protein [Talaromyces proteolyticus]KAH8693153.1 putative ras guanine-nucleotide exchange protein [Talaromyces proteolyticus]